MDALKQLQRVMRQRPVVSAGVVTRRELPDGLGQGGILGLTRDQDSAIRLAERALLADERFEHLKDAVNETVWLFASRSALEARGDFVGPFETEHARTPESLLCYVAVEHLKVSAACDCAGLRFVPVDSDEIPKFERMPDFLIPPPTASVAIVTVTGTDPDRMADRGRSRVADALRVMKIALREQLYIANFQLRFRVGRAYILGRQRRGWSLPADTPVGFELTAAMVEQIGRSEIALLARPPVTNIEKQASIAARWMERAMSTGEPIVALLFLFFALEALVGDRSERQKGHLLAFRQTMLSHVLKGSFTPPNETLYLYEIVRSGAVHGEDAPDVDSAQVEGLAWTVRSTLSLWIRFARENRISKRSRLVQALDQHVDRPQLQDWLIANAGPSWAKYFES